MGVARSGSNVGFGSVPYHGHALCHIIEALWWSKWRHLDKVIGSVFFSPYDWNVELNQHCQKPAPLPAQTKIFNDQKKQKYLTPKIVFFFFHHFKFCIHYLCVLRLETCITLADSLIQLECLTSHLTSVPFMYLIRGLYST